MAKILILGNIKSITPVRVVENMPLVVSDKDTKEVLAYLDWDMEWHCSEKNREKVKAIFKQLKEKEI